MYPSMTEFHRYARARTLRKPKMRRVRFLSGDEVALAILAASSDRSGFDDERNYGRGARTLLDRLLDAGR